MRTIKVFPLRYITILWCYLILDGIIQLIVFYKGIKYEDCGWSCVYLAMVVDIFFVFILTTITVIIEWLLFKKIVHNWVLYSPLSFISIWITKLPIPNSIILNKDLTLLYLLCLALMPFIIYLLIKYFRQKSDLKDNL